VVFNGNLWWTWLANHLVSVEPHHKAMSHEAKYWRDKWLDAKKQIEALVKVIQEKETPENTETLTGKGSEVVNIVKKAEVIEKFIAPMIHIDAALAPVEDLTNNQT